MKKWKKTLCRVLAMCFLLASMVVAGGTVAEAKSGKWKHDSKGYYYAFSDGTYAKSQWVLIQNKYYHFDSKGYMETGWKKLGGKWYYLKPSGAMATGWTRVGGNWYYFNPKGVMQTGWKQISGKWYFFETSGVWVKNKAGGSSVKEIKVGDYVSFGTYEQDNDKSTGKESIEWQVLAKNGDQYLVISRYILDCQIYSNHKINAGWENSALRKWLNDDFYYGAFTEAERSKIQSKTIENEGNDSYGVEGGKSTTDKIYPLSIVELAKYFNLEKVQSLEVLFKGDACCAAATKTAVADGVEIETRKSYRYSKYTGNGAYWVRNPGNTKISTSYVSTDGKVCVSGTYADAVNIGIRPAMWVTLDY